MGLGKTVQICAYLNGLFESDQIKKAIVVVPATMKSYWQAELCKWCPTAPHIISFEDKKRADREKQIKTLKREGGVLITSFGMVTSMRIELSEMRYDVLVVDEGHKAKNINTELRRNLVAMRVKGHRLILTGTPLQNNLNELWSVFDFIQPKIFGSFNKFTRDYADTIERGMMKDASTKDKVRASELSAKLRKMYERHFLRRTKNQIFKVVSAETLGRPLNNNELPLKTDLVVWLPLTDI
jgi:SNF2 family DNA or RNA helicase